MTFKIRRYREMMHMPARKPKTGEKPQFERFIETARRIEASDDDTSLDRAIRRIIPPRYEQKRSGTPKAGEPRE